MFRNIRQYVLALSMVWVCAFTGWLFAKSAEAAGRKALG